MNQIQYDSFYKFLVSVGILLVIAPLFGLYYLLCNGNQMLISQSEYENLSMNSLRFIQQRDFVIGCAFSILPWLFFILVIIGILCIIFGCVRWYMMQKELDAQTQLKTEEQRINIKQLGSQEILDKAKREVSNEKNQEGNVSKADTRDSEYIKWIEIENKCFYYIKKKIAMHYDVRQNIKIGNTEIDMIAISKESNTDILYEIKYWPSGVNFRKLTYVGKQMISMGISYESTTQRNWKAVLLLVTSKEHYKIIKSEIGEYVKDHSIKFHIQVISESDFLQ